jgi:hypothetical protein
MCLLPGIGNLAAWRGDGLFTKEQLFSGVLRKLSITLCKTSARLEQGVSGFLWGPAGCASGMARDAPPLRSVIGISALP